MQRESKEKCSKKEEYKREIHRDGSCTKENDSDTVTVFFERFYSMSACFGFVCV